MKNLDRFVHERNAGYRKEDFQLCDICKGKDDNPRCSSCGGYGEIPLRRPLATPSKELK